MFSHLGWFRKPFVAAAITATSLCAHADYPERAITIVIPYAPGGTNDVVARLVARQLGGQLNKEIVPENRAGGGGVIGWQSAVRAPADGYTLLSMDMSYTIAAGLIPKLGFDPKKDFTPVATVASTPFVMVVKSDFPARSVAEFVAAAKNAPGKLNYGSAGNGTNSQLAAEVFKMNNSVFITHVPYKGASAVLQDLMGGQVDVLFTALPTALPHIKSGRLKALMVTSAERLPALPGVPAAKEAGQAGMQMDFWAGVAVRTGTPQPLIDRLNKAIVESISRPEAKKVLEEQGLYPVMDTPALASKRMLSEIDRWSAVSKAAKITMD
jgi:tripartite-type tricarboxylate transporter receptor subunit TctC